ncbi:MAG: histidine kinase [Pseudomonadota bacterium]|nr:histidine kinase [Pseudomonadota bacterium]
MLPLLFASSLLPFAQRAGGWIGAWVCLLAVNALGAAVALPLYHWWSATLACARLPDLQLLACAFGLATAILGLPLWHRQIKQLAALRHAALASELKALQAQIEPHFLYNTLGNARYLARHDPERAVQMLEHLIAYLRSALPDLRAQESNLGRECELAGHYLALMQVRFGERLQYRVDCPPSLLALNVAPLLLMTLVENAVQHGVEPQPGMVTVLAGMAVDGVRIDVSDDGAGIGDAVLGSGVGLHNLRERLHALYGDNARFLLSPREGGGVTATLVLPI